MIVLTAVKNVEPSSVHTSETVQITVAGQISAVNGILVVNGTDVGATATVAIGANVALKVTASASLITTVWATLTANDQTYGFPLITKKDPTDIFVQALANQPPLAHTEAILNGPTWVPAPEPKIFAYNISANTNQVITVDRNVTGNGATDVKEYLFLADFYDNVVYRQDLQSNTTLQKITAGQNPIGLVYGKGPAPDARSVPYVLNFGDNTLSRLSLTDYTAEATIAVGQKPIAAIKDGADVLWVANFGSNNVSRITIDQATQSVTANTLVSVGQGPTHLIEDTAHIWVVCAADSTLSRIAKADQTVTSFPTGSSVPWSITQDTTHLYIGHIGENKVTKVEKATPTNVTAFTVGTAPAWVDHDGTSLFVADYEDNTFNRVDTATGAVSNTTAVPATPYGIQVSPIDTNTVFVGSNYANTPSRIKARDYDTDSPVNFATITGAILDTDTLSNVVTITGIDQQLPVSAAPVGFTWNLIKNGTDVGQSTTVQEGDTLGIKVRSSTVNATTSTLALSIGDQVATFAVTTLVSNSIPSPFTFSGTGNNLPGATVRSGAVTISGLSPGLQLNVSTDKGVLVKNNVSSGTGPITVTNGDTLDIELTAGANSGDTEIALIDMGAFDLPYVLQTREDPTLFLMSTDYAGSRPREFPIAYDGTGSDPKLLITDIATQVTTEVLASTVPAEGAEAAGEFNNSNDYYLLPDTYGNRILRASEAGALVDGIALPANTAPTSVSFTPGRAVANNVVPKVLTAGDTHISSISHSTWQVEHSFTLTEGKIHGIAGSRETGTADTYSFATTYEDSTTQSIKFWTLNNSGITLSRTAALPAGSKPLSIVLDPEAQNMWVTLVGTNQIAKVNVATYGITLYDVGRTPWGILVEQDHVYVSCALDGTVERYARQDMTLESKVQLRNTPYNMALNSTTNKLYVTCFESNAQSIVEVDTASTLTKTSWATTVPAPSIFLHGTALTSGNKLFTFKQYSGANSTRITRPDTEPNNLLLDVFAATKGQTFTSTAMTVSAVSRPDIRLRLPNLFNARFVVDGTELTNDVRVQQGSQVQVRLDLINETNYRHNVPIIMEDYVYNWKVTTEPDLVPLPFSFVAKSDLFLGPVFESNEVTLDGMTQGETTDMIVSANTGVILNNVDQTPGTLPTTPTTVQVKNGDKFKLYGQAGRPYGQTAVHNANINGTTADFLLTSKALGVLDLLAYNTPTGTQSLTVISKTQVSSAGPTAAYTASKQEAKPMPMVGPSVKALPTTASTFKRKAKSNTVNSSSGSPLAYASTMVQLTGRTAVPDIRRRRQVQQNPTVLQLESARATVLVLEQDYQKDHRQYTDPLVNKRWLKFDPLLEKPFDASFGQYSPYVYSAADADFGLKPVNTTAEKAQHSFTKQDTLTQRIDGSFQYYVSPEYSLAGTSYTNALGAFFYSGQQFTAIPEFMWLVNLPFVPTPSTVMITVASDQFSIKPNPAQSIAVTGFETQANPVETVSSSFGYTASKTFENAWAPAIAKVTNTRLQQGHTGIPAISAVRQAPSAPVVVQSVSTRQEITHKPITAFVSNLQHVGTNFTQDQEPWFDNGPSFTASDKNYYASQALAEQACIAAGYAASDCITIEMETNGWIWAHKADDKTEACGSQDDIRVRGWIRGG